MTKDRIFLLRLMHLMILEIRFEAIQIKSKKVYALSDLLHGLPLGLANAKTDDDIEKIIESFEEKIKDTNMEDWYKSECQSVEALKALTDKFLDS